MSGFIPMVSTTPPPMDDGDDFGDFMDSTQQDDDDFDDFSNPVNYDEDSYPSMNSPPGIDRSMNFPSDDNISSPGKISSFNNNDEVSARDKQQYVKEVETIFHESEIKGRNEIGNEVQSMSSMNNSDEQKDNNAFLGFESHSNSNHKNNTEHSSVLNHPEITHNNMAKRNGDSDDFQVESHELAKTEADTASDDSTKHDDILSGGRDGKYIDQTQNNMTVLNNFDNGEHVTESEEKSEDVDDECVEVLDDDRPVTDIPFNQGAINFKQSNELKSKKCSEIRIDDELKESDSCEDLSKLKIQSLNDEMPETSISVDLESNATKDVVENSEVLVSDASDMDSNNGSVPFANKKKLTEVISDPNDLSRNDINDEQTNELCPGLQADLDRKSDNFGADFSDFASVPIAQNIESSSISLDSPTNDVNDDQTNDTSGEPSNNSQAEVKSDDSDDDFADFQTISAAESTGIQNQSSKPFNPQSASDIEMDSKPQSDDFANFKSVPVKRDSKQENVDYEDETDNNFDAFKSSNGSSSENNNDNIAEMNSKPESDDFTDFESVSLKTDSKQQVENGGDQHQTDDSFDAFKSSDVASSGHNNDHITEMNSNPESDDFTDFASVSLKKDSKQENVDDEDQTGDSFDTFKSSNVVSSAHNNDHHEGDPTFECDFDAFDNNPTNDSDGFADFSAASSTNKKDADDFGDFETGTADNDDDFAEFGTGTTSWSSVSDTVKNIPTVNEKVECFVLKYIKRKDDVDSSLAQIQIISELMNSDVENHSTVSGESLQLSCSGELWNQLEDIDNTLALNFVWNGSGHNKHLLDSLGMHTQNILFSGTKQAYYVPTYYAAGLGMMDPNKGILKPMSAAEKITAMSPTEKAAPAILQEDTLQASEINSEWKTVAENHGSENSMFVDGSWSRNDDISNNSAVDVGVPIRIISSSMDLDYFENLSSGGVDGVKSSVKTDLIDPELLELTTAPTTEPPPPPKDSGSATLSKILASIKSANNTSSTISTLTVSEDASKWAEEESKLSSEARAVLQKLPDLSYMKSRTLVFPISTSRVNIDDGV